MGSISEMMRSVLSARLHAAGSLLMRASKKVYRSSAERRVIPWFHDRGDQTLRLDYDLGPESVVFDIGGYEGQWSSDIFGRYCCFVHVFEPVETFAAAIEQRFAKNDMVVVHRFGLAGATKSIPIGMDRDASSMYKATSGSDRVRLVRACDFLEESRIRVIDLMKINIEGGEYELLEHLIESGWITRIRDIQVQFHDFVPDAEGRMAALQLRLEATHYTTYQYPFVWENWRRK
jgi:FkbM family methyltransferase